MKKLAIPMALAAIVTLSACAGHRPAPVAGVNNKAASETLSAARTGRGQVIVLTDPTGPVDGISTQYLLVQMSDGSRQNVVQRGPQLRMGDRVVISESGIRRSDPLALQN
jgi:hypothetical protein